MAGPGQQDPGFAGTKNAEARGEMWHPERFYFLIYKI